MVCQIQSHINDGALFTAAVIYYLEIIRYYNSVAVPSTTKLLSITQGNGEDPACNHKLVKIRVHGQDCLVYPFYNCEGFAFVLHT